MGFGHGLQAWALGTRHGCQLWAWTLGERAALARRYALGGTLNTGLLFIRPTAAGVSFAQQWHSHVVDPPATRQFAPPGCCSSDQQVFNRMVKPSAKFRPGDRTALVNTRDGAANGSLTLGSLPLCLFAHGHVHFVQRGGKCGVAPYAVHATYSLDEHDHVAKQQRFREAGLWRADGPDFRKQQPHQQHQHQLHNSGKNVMSEIREKTCCLCAKGEKKGGANGRVGRAKESTP